MIIQNDICYAGEPRDEIRVTAAEPLRDRILLVTFSNGEKRLFDAGRLKGSVFKPLADERIFRAPVLFHGVITWKDGEIDIAPETVYRDSLAYQEA